MVQKGLNPYTKISEVKATDQQRPAQAPSAAKETRNALTRPSEWRLLHGRCKISGRNQRTRHP